MLPNVIMSVSRVVRSCLVVIPLGLSRDPIESDYSFNTEWSLINFSLMFSVFRTRFMSCV